MTLKDMHKYFVGFDEAQLRLQRLHEQMAAKAANSAYPPYNVRKAEDHTYLLELAVAGFGEDEIDIEIYNGQLTITANKREDVLDKEFKNWIHQGIAYRGFSRTFYIDNQYEILLTQLKDGLLKVYFGVQEDKKPKKINVGYQKNQKQQQLELQ